MKDSFWNGLTAEEWRALLKEKYDSFLRGEYAIELPENFYSIEEQFGKFIQIQASSFLDDEPEVLVRTSYYGPMLKVLIPKHAKTGDKIRIVKMAKSGKSYIAEIEK